MVVLDRSQRVKQNLGIWVLEEREFRIEKTINWRRYRVPELELEVLSVSVAATPWI